MVRKFILAFLPMLLLTLLSVAQTAPDKYWIQFTDKNNSTYSITQPAQFLSAKAIQRRVNQNIPIAINDLPVNENYISVIESLGATVLNKSKWLNAVTIYAPTMTMLNQVLAQPFVSGFHKVASLETKLVEGVDLTNNKSRYNGFTPANNIDYGDGLTQIEMLNGHILHDQGFRGEGIVIAVLDAGFYNVDIISAFDSLWINNRILGTWDFVSNESSVFEDYTHGMQVLSTMGANLPGQFVGTAPGASYWLLRTEDVGSEYMIEEDNWIAGAEFADSVGADVLNTSLGYTVFTDAAQNHFYKDMDGNTTRITIGSDIAASKGMLVVNSAGNSGSSAWQYVSAPADGDSVLAVGAVDANGLYAAFSSQGPSFDGRVKPNVVAMGAGSTVISSSGNVTAGNGTSFASPILAGMAACLWQANPSFTSMDLFRAIEESASQYQNPDNFLGYGIPDFAAANIILHNKLKDRESLVKAYPNPFTNNFTIQFYETDSQEVFFELMDLQGRVYATEIAEDTRFSVNYIHFSGLSYLSSGLYFIRITGDAQVRHVKLIKQ